MVCELPVDEKIIRLFEGEECIYILTEFHVFKLDKASLSNIEGISFEGRDRPLMIQETESGLFLVTAQGRLYNLRSKQVYQLQSDASLFYSAAILESGEQITVAFGTIFSGVLIAQLIDDIFQETFTLTGHKGTVFEVQFHRSNPDILFSCADDRSLKKWNLKAKSHQTFLGHEARVWRIAVSEEVVCSVSEDNTCRVWDHEGILETVIDCNPFAKNTLSVSVCDSLVAIGSSDHSQYLYNRSKRTEALLNDFKPTEIRNFCVDCDGTIYLSSATGDIYCDSNVIGKIESLSRYSVPCISDELLVFGDVKGSLHWTRKGEIDFQSLQVGTGKISKIFPCQDKKFVVELNEQKCFLFDGGTNVIELKCESSFKCTSALIYEDFVYLGCRSGDLLKFELTGKLIQCLNLTPGESVKSLSLIRIDLALLIGTHSGMLFKVAMSTLNVISKQLFCKDEIVAFCNENRLIAAFQQNCLCLIELCSGIIVERIECKGSHRLWSLSQSQDSLLFAFLSDGFLTLKHANFNRIRLVTPAHHGQEIRCSINFNEIVASGSEDGLLVLSKNGQVIHSVRSPKNSSIKALCFCGNVLFSAGANESIDAWNWDGMKLRHLASAPKESSLIESRVMAVAVAGEQIFAGYSNSSIACWSFLDDKFSIDWIQTEIHCGKFLQQLRIFGDKLLTTGTDGLVKLWHIERGSLYQLSQVCAHASGINALDVFEERLIVTGGDDGFVSVMEIEGTRLKLQNRIQAHHSTCTAVKFLNETRLISASADQRIIIRELSNLKPLTKRISTISDIAALSLEPTNDSFFVTVYGLGQESFIILESE